MNAPTPAADITQAPLYAGLPEQLQVLLQLGQATDNSNLRNPYLEKWRSMVATGNLASSAYMGHANIGHGAYLLFKALNDWLVIQSPTGPIPLKDRVEEIRLHQERTLNQMITGQSSEFNGLIERIVQRKLQDLGAALQEQLNLNENALQVNAALQDIRNNTQAMGQGTLEERLGTFFVLCQRIRDIFGDRMPHTNAEEALLRIVALVNSLPRFSESEQTISSHISDAEEALSRIVNSLPPTRCDSLPRASQNTQSRGQRADRVTQPNAEDLLAQIRGLVGTLPSVQQNKGT